MAKIISLLGNKGGTGKTTLSHMLGQGLGLLGVRAVVALTDATREPLSRLGRRYLPTDARRAEDLKKVAQTLRGVPGWVGVIDGGAGRLEFDLELAAMSDLVLLPFRESHEDIRVVLQDLVRMPHALAVPSQWPTNAWAREAAERTRAAMLATHRDRMLDPVSALGPSKLLLQAELPASLPAALDAACRDFAMAVASAAGIEIDAGGNRVDRQGMQRRPMPRVVPAPHASAPAR